MCADYGGHLVSIQDKYENDFLVKAMENFYVEFVWIGMNDLHEEGIGYLLQSTAQCSI